MKKNNFILLIGMVLALAISSISAADVNYCCEKTTSGAWCQDAPLSDCDSSYLNSPTSCDSTSYCKKGCCFDSIEGTCMESTSQRVCSDSGGTWADSKTCGIVQCNLGCCILGDQGAFVTLTRCKALAGYYGLKNDFRKDIADELTCISTAQGADKGACVVEDPETGGKACTFTSRAACSVGTVTGEVVNITGTNQTNATTGFYKDILCSAEELGTECGPSTKTMIIDGKDEVYFQDTCGNSANIYDASKYSDKDYWKTVYKKSQSCGYGSDNSNSATCGNCDYYYGSIGRKSTSSTATPTYGDYICIDLNCKDQNKKHGESWCLSDSPTGDGQDTVGSRYYKEVCVFGEVLTEPCADYRNEVCTEDTFGTFTEAACRVNRWQDCLSQADEEQCNNTNLRDCHWFYGYYYSSNSGQIERTVNESEAKAKGISVTPEGICVPNYPPGFQFWGSSSGTTSSSSANTTTPAFNSSTPAFGTGYVDPSSAGADASSQCGLGNSNVNFKWTKTTHPLIPSGFLGNIVGLGSNSRSTDWECANNSIDCQKYISNPKLGNISNSEAAAWAVDMNGICYELGDCGGYNNWVGVYTDEGYSAYVDQKRIAGGGGAKIREATSGSTNNAAGSTSSTSTSTSTTGKVTGNMISDLIKRMSGK